MSFTGRKEQEIDIVRLIEGQTDREIERRRERTGVREMAAGCEHRFLAEGIVLRWREIALLPAILGSIANLAAALGPLACLAAAIGPLAW